MNPQQLRSVLVYPSMKRKGTMIVDIGGGTTEVAAIAMGGVVVSRSLRVAGDELDQDIINYIRNKYNLFIGERMAEKVKNWHWFRLSLKEELTMEVRGRNLVTGLPEAIEVSSVEIREAMASSIAVIVKRSEMRWMKHRRKYWQT
jgi:rod shape-determining protein MreB and related proteins